MEKITNHVNFICAIILSKNSLDTTRDRTDEERSPWSTHLQVDALYWVHDHKLRKTPSNRIFLINTTKNMIDCCPIDVSTDYQ